MIAATYAVFVIICVALIVVVLLQSGKGAGLGAAFGGASQTVFGSQGRASFLTKTTAGLAAAFMLISLFLAWESSRTSGGGLMQDYQEQPGGAPEMPTGAIPPGGSQPMTLPDLQTDEVAPAPEEAPAGMTETPRPETAPAPTGILEDEPPEPMHEPGPSE